MLTRRAGYEAWTEPRLVLDTSQAALDAVLADALDYLR
jgi:hypothetical protein